MHSGLFVEDGEPLKFKVFVDRSVVEALANDRKCSAVRVYPGRTGSVSVSLVAHGQDTVLRAIDF